jgi:hypothetical protein
MPDLAVCAGILQHSYGHGQRLQSASTHTRAYTGEQCASCPNQAKIGCTRAQ